MGLFKAKSIVPAEDEAWHLDTWAWLLANWGGMADFEGSPLITPTAEFFPATGLKGHERAEAAFDVVKRHAKMGAWRCRLVAQPGRPDTRVSRGAFLKMLKGNPAGTFGWDASAGEVVITYDPGLLDDPYGLIATLSHELAHYRMGVIGGEPPGGKEMEEYATDLATVYLGFGLFGANCAFRYSQSNTSWQWSKQGYLQQTDWLFALAVFLSLKGLPAKQAQPYLADHLAPTLDKACRYLAENPTLIERLKAVEPKSQAEPPEANSETG